MGHLSTPPDETVHGIAKAGFSLIPSLARHVERQAALWTKTLAAGAGLNLPDMAETDGSDRRFKGPRWSEHPGYNLLKQSYLLNSELLGSMVEQANLDRRQKNRLRFFTRQFIDAMSPANFGATNPDALEAMLASNGESVKTGMALLVQDAVRGRISITDESAFEVGQHVAASKGAVVFENDVMQLIQYAPLTAKVAARPLLIVPPCINKFYILDLQPENSFVRFACEQGLTVFLVSWRNPDAALGHLAWDDYVERGVMKAIDVASDIGRADRIHALGWCVGGTLPSSALAVGRARGAERVASLTLLTTMLDFEEPGDLGVFLDEASVTQREMTIGRGGIYPGAELGFVFQMLRANDLIWPYVVDNYLKGKAPAAFDLLYWNADATNLPGPMLAWYLRNMYLENSLREPDRLSICGTPVDLGRLDMPTYVLATQEDHIVPWQSAYRTAGLVGGTCEFVLGASGHIAGVINPASKNKRSHWTGGTLGADPGNWLATADARPGSWWTHWAEWIRPQSGRQVPARRTLGNATYQPVEAAPGQYVKVRAG